jgi:hypothetical protein
MVLGVMLSSDGVVGPGMSAAGIAGDRWRTAAVT